jgi:hypothetical protein
LSISHDAEPKRYLTLIKQPHSTPPTPLLSQVCTSLLKLFKQKIGCKE